MNRWSELDAAIVARLKTGTVLKKVVSAATPDSAPQNETASPSAVVASIGTTSAEGESWAVERSNGGKPVANDWLHFIVAIHAKNLTSLRDARDEVRRKLQGWEPAPLTVDEVLIEAICEAEVPDESAPDQGLTGYWRVGVYSDEGEAA